MIAVESIDDRVMSDWVIVHTKNRGKLQYPVSISGLSGSFGSVETDWFNQSKEWALISFFILLPRQHNKFDFVSDLYRMNRDQFQWKSS